MSAIMMAGTNVATLQLQATPYKIANVDKAETRRLIKGTTINGKFLIKISITKSAKSPNRVSNNYFMHDKRKDV
jgi:hypothetical protein